MAWTRDQMAARAAKELKRRLLRQSRHRHPDAGLQLHPRRHRACTLQSRERHARHGPLPASRARTIPDLINAGKQTITELPTAAYFSSADSFAMIRGGHIDLSILGAMQVAENGDLANWMIPGKMVKGMGGAMDLVAGVQQGRRRHGACRPRTAPKLLHRCNLPLTGAGVVDLVITDLGVFAIDKKGGTGMTLIEIADGVTLDEIKANTEASFKVATALAA